MSVFPENWKTHRLDALGHIHAGRQRSPLFTEGSEYCYLRVANVFDGRIDTRDVFTMLFTSREFDAYALKYGDILLNEGQSLELVGRAAIYKGDPPNCCFQNTLVRFRPNATIDPLFAFYLLQYYFYTGRFSSIASQTTSVAHLGVSRFAALRATIPPLPEQKKIAEILSCWDSAIEKIEKLIDAKVRFKKGLTQRLLGGVTRLDGFRQTWSEDYLGNLFTERLEKGRPDLPLLAITSERGIVPRDSLDRRDTSNEDKSNYSRIASGDIGYNTMRMWQGVSGLSQYEGIVSPAYTILVPGAKVCPVFFAHFFKYPPLVHMFWRFSQGLVDDTLNLKFPSFRRIKVKFPMRDEQERIAQVLSCQDTEVIKLNVLLETFKQQKKGLMQKLLTGKIRVNAESLRQIELAYAQASFG